MDSLMSKAFGQYEADLIRFVQELVRIPSYSDQEQKLAECVKAKMEELGYDEAYIDATGNLVGRIGNGPQTILFDSHMDTVEVTDAAAWCVPPFSGEIVDGRLYGRGSVDMKGALACSVYAGKIAKDLGWQQGKTIYVCGTVCEEFCDGVSLRLLLEQNNIKPDAVVICEPSDNVITLGHKGKAQVLITAHGVSAHGSAPEQGRNAVYEMAEIIQRVEKLNQTLTDAGQPHGTVVLSDISCVSVSLNAVPSECSIYLDRRLALGETEEQIRQEMDGLVAGKRADWQVGTLHRHSWTGAQLDYEPLHTAWQIEEDQPLSQTLIRAYQEVYGSQPACYDFWDFGTNAVTPVAMGIPTIGFGPGEYKLAHMIDENCEVAKLSQACQFYAHVIGQF